jgi:hypothetical protein
MKIQAAEWEKIFSNDIPNKESVCRVYKEDSMLNGKKPAQLKYR